MFRYISLKKHTIIVIFLSLNNPGSNCMERVEASDHLSWKIATKLKLYLRSRIKISTGVHDRPSYRPQQTANQTQKEQQCQKETPKD